jgi:hypothetical protein
MWQSHQVVAMAKPDAFIHLEEIASVVALPRKDIVTALKYLV